MSCIYISPFSSDIENGCCQSERCSKFKFQLWVKISSFFEKSFFLQCLPVFLLWLHRCWWRISATKYVPMVTSYRVCWPSNITLPPLKQPLSSSLRKNHDKTSSHISSVWYKNKNNGICMQNNLNIVWKLCFAHLSPTFYIF